jgi:hypothetical protein
MPTFDSGRCFLTALLPIKTMEIVDNDGMCCSPVHMVRDALAVLPTARQSPVTACLPKVSPFARNPHTHFARFVVIDDVVFNGRMPTNAILDRSERTVGRPIDQLPCPYLLFAADFDAPNGTDKELREWLRSIWTEMRADLEPVFSHCHGYKAKAGTADGFADYVVECQVETTMPFNDYWPGAPPLTAMSIPLLIAAGVATALAVGGGLWALAARVGWAQWLWPWLYCAEVLGIVLVALVAGVYVAYRWVMRHGAKPFPMAPNSDLPSVLKSLYLQRQITRFAIDMQGKDDQSLYTAFGGFLQEHRPHDTKAKTQERGVIPVGEMKL